MRFDRDAMLEHFGDRYHEVEFRGPGPARRLSLWHTLRKQFVRDEYEHNTWIDDWYSAEVDDDIQAIGAEIQPDIVLAEYVFFSKALLRFPADVLKVIDTHDRFGNRFQMFQSHGVKPAWLSAFPADEMRCLARADRVIAIQNADAAYFRRRLGSRVYTVGHRSAVKMVPFPSFNRALLFVGGYNAINVDALSFCVEEILPRIRLRHRDAELLIVGALADMAPDAPGVRKIGPLEDLDTAYALARIVVNPCRFGTGLKTKNVEAMAYGRALVTTTHGAEGLEAAVGKALLVADNAEAFAAAVCELLDESPKVDELSAEGQKFVSRWNAEQDQALWSTFDI
ncbi:MAG: glycosyltransferase [Pseudomonadota bacterium]